MISPAKRCGIRNPDRQCFVPVVVLIFLLITVFKIGLPTERDFILRSPLIGRNHSFINVTKEFPTPTPSAERRPNAHVNDIDVPMIYVVTPTYARLVQLAELTNMCNLMRHVTNLRWLVIEDSLNKTKVVTRFLSNCPVKSVHFNLKGTIQIERTIPQRNLAFDWIRNETKASGRKGVFYFADDDNTYNPRLFSEMRYTKGISVWPVGFAAAATVEGPLVENGKVVDWMSGWIGGRKFPIDMAGFAINVQLLLDYPKNQFSYSMGSGQMETTIIEGFHVNTEDLEPRADNCTKVLVWHTKRTRPQERHPSFKFDNKRRIPKTLEAHK